MYSRSILSRYIYKLIHIRILHIHTYAHVYISYTTRKMPKKYYCDFCDMYLMKSSQGSRKQHLQGYKHRDNVIAWYGQYMPGFMNSQDGFAWQTWFNTNNRGQELQFPPLKEGWVMKKDTSQGGRPYFYNEELKITQWEYPGGTCLPAAT